MASFPWLQQSGLHVLEPEHALLCSPCKVALPVKSEHVFHHLQERHDLSGPYHDLHASQLDLLMLTDVANLKPRSDNSSALPDLVVAPGYSCRRCAFRTSSQQLLSRHLPTVHQVSWKAARDGGDYNQVSLQRWTGGGRNIGAWWIVSLEVSTSAALIKALPLIHITRQGCKSKRPVSRQKRPAEGRWLLQAAATKPLIPSLLTQVLKEEQRQQDVKHPSQPTRSDVEDISLTDTWLRRTGWKETYRDNERNVLLCLAQLPTRQSRMIGLSLGEGSNRILYSSATDECKITGILQRVDGVFNRCEETVGRTSNSVLCWLRSKRHSEPSPFPFQLVGRKVSQQKYRSRWKQCLAMVLRIIRQPEANICNVANIPFTPEQKEVLRQIWSLADKTLNAQLYSESGEIERDDTLQDPLNDSGSNNSDDSNDSDDSDDSDDIHDSDDFNNSNNKVNSDESIDRPKDNSHDNQSQNLVEVFQILSHDKVVSITERRPSIGLDSQEVEERISQLLFKISALLITQEFRDGNPASSTLIFLSGVFSFTAEGKAYQRPRNYTPILSALIYSQRLLFLEYVLPCREYRHLGWPARPQQGHLESLRMARHQFMCFGCESPFGELSSLLAYGRKLLRSDGPVFFIRWSDDGQTLFFDEEHLHLTQFRAYANRALAQAVFRCEDLMLGWNPDFNLHEVRDRFTNLSPDYSFVNEPANGLTDVYTHLLTRLCTTGPRPLIQNNAWHHAAVTNYLQRHESFLEALMALLFLSSGQVPRGVDLCSLEVRNTENNPRGIYVYDGRMMYVIRHHKARRSTNHEFYVARYLPSCAFRPLYQYLVYIRPTVETLLRHCFQERQVHTLLFSTNLIVARRSSYRQWNCQDLSRALQSHNILRFRLGTRLCRQLTIAMTEKHVRAAMYFNQYDDRSQRASLETVLAWQSGHRPLQRATNYGLDGAFPHQLQPNLLRLYARASEHWHRFLSFGSATADSRQSFKPTQLPVQAVQPVIFSDHGRRQPLSELSQATIRHIPATTYQGDENIDSGRETKRQKLEIHSAVNTATSQASMVERRAPSPARCPGPAQNPSRDSQPTVKEFTFSTIFVHFRQYQIIVCHCCQSPRAVPPAQVKAHLRSHHPFIPVKARESIVHHVQKMLHLAWQPQDVMWPDPWDEPVEGLLVYSDAYRCLATNLNGTCCRKVLRNLRGIQNHCSEEHGWVNQQQRGGNTLLKEKQSPNRLGQDSQRCQEFFQVGQWKGYFQVQSRLTRCTANDQ
jgi:hypothetical protein